MKKTFRILSCFVCVLFISALVLTGCNFGIIPQSTTPTNNETEDNSPNESHGKQIPVYQGMSISTSLGVTIPSFEGQGNNGNGNGNGNSNTDNNGNHNGWYKGDSADNQGDVDQETPFPDADENIEQEIKDSLEVIGSKQDIYYATPNQNIYIHIYISNPNQFEILSFTLNGQKYSSYMFESGSTQELLILKLNVGDAHGIVDYTIDQIKYIDGTEIKDVKIGGDQTVKAGIRTEDQVTANVTDLQIGTNSISFNATVTDRDNLIAYNNGVIKAVLFNGEALVAEKELTLGANTVAFDNLTNGTVYQYAIVACYDNLTGDEIGFHILAKEALQTNNIVLFDNIVIGQDSINFTFKWDDSVSNKVLTGLNLYKNSEFVTALGVDALTATQLLSANEYVLVAEYQDLGQPATISLTFATLEKGVPGIFITNTSATQTGIAFDIEESDIDSVGAITKIELVHANGTVVADNVDVRNFENLLSNNAYTVKVTYTYDLNDGKGEQTIIKEKEIVTLAKAVPEISIINPTETQTSVGFEVAVTDTDNVGAIAKIELVHKNGTVVAENVDVRSFENLLSNNTYMVKVTYTYDLNDGRGEQTIVKTTDITTEAKTAPQFTINNVEMTSTSFKGDCEIIDIDSVLVSYVVELYKGETLIAQSADGNIAFENLEDAEYTLKVSYTYDLNDGKGVQASAYFQKIQTTFTLTESNRYMMGAIGDENGNLVIPAFFEYENVWYCVTSIGDYAFYYNDSLTSVTLPNSVTSIGDSAFSNCSNLTSFIIPESVTNIGNSAFSNSTGLKDVYFCSPTPPAMGHDVFGYVWDYDDFSIHVPEASYNLYTKINDGGYWQTWACPRIRKWNGWCFHTYESEVTAPTKTTEGYTTNICTVCGNSYKYNYVPAIGSEGLAYELNDNGGITITGIGTCTDTEIYIPEMIDGYTVTVIGEKAFAENSTITFVKISNTVTTIGKRAFYKCTALEEIFIPESVNDIGTQIFFGCDKLTTVYYNSTYGSFENPFLNVKNLETVVFGGTSVPSYITYGATSLKTVFICDSVTSIGSRTFYDCCSLTSITIPNSVTHIGEYAFYGCSNLTSITIPDSVNNIGTAAFADCRILECINIGNGVPVIVDGMFEGCSSLTSITIPDSVTSIGYFAFQNCTSLTSITIPDSVTSIGNSAFKNCTSLTSITIPDSVTSIDIQAFNGCSSLMSITIPDSVTSISEYAFLDCTNLTSITIPNSVTSIGLCAFSGCSSLTNIIIPNSVTSIGLSAFNGCSSLTSITIPNSVISIGESAFYHCSSLTSINFEGSVTQWNAISKHEDWDSYSDNYAVYCTDGILCKNHVEVIDEAVAPTCTKSGRTEGKHCSVCGMIIVGQEGIPANGHNYEGDFCSVCGCDFSTEGLEFTLNDDGVSYSVTGIGTCADTELVIPAEHEGLPVTAIGKFAFSKCQKITSVKIPDSVVEIQHYAFQQCILLTNVTIPNSVVTISYNAFEGCTSLANITLPDSVQTIGDNAFQNCTALTSFIVPNSVSSIGRRAFDGCTSLSYNVYDNAYYLGSQDNPYYALLLATSTDITSCVTHADTKIICGGAFYECTNLTDVTIVDEVKGIGNYAFHGCSAIPTIVLPSNLKFMGNYVFQKCAALESIVIPEGIKKLNDYSFAGCESLASIVLPEGLTAIGGYVFRDCISLTSITIPQSVNSLAGYAFYNCSALTGIVIPAGVPFIGAYTFYGCASLYHVEIPESVTRIGNYAFRNCYALKELIFTGTITQWKAIEFGKDWQVNVSVYTKVTCSDGTAPIR